MNNKSFCAEEISGLIQELDQNFSEYEDKADIFISHCNEFKDNDSYQGTNAVAAKIIVGEKEVELANLQKELHTKLLDMYKHTAQSFADKVDSAPNARLDLDALTISENGLKSIYGKMDDYCCKFENIAKEMQNKYGHIGTITVPDCNPLRESMINLCGGDIDNAGFLYELKRKLIEFDEEECTYIDNINYIDELRMLNEKICNINLIFNSENKNDSLLINKSLNNINLQKARVVIKYFDVYKYLSGLKNEKGERLYTNGEIVDFLYKLENDGSDLLVSLDLLRRFQDGEYSARLKKIAKELERSAPYRYERYFNQDLYDSNIYYKHTADKIASISGTVDDDRLPGLLEAYEKNKDVYINISQQTGMPPELLAAIHYREDATDFTNGTFGVYILNGDELGKETEKDPKGLYYSDFTECAVDWFTGKTNDNAKYHADHINELGLTSDSKDLVAMVTFCNLYNGMNFSIVSSYAYNGTDIYSGGLFVSDGNYDENADDKNLGTYVLLKYLLENES